MSCINFEQKKLKTSKLVGSENLICLQIGEAIAQPDSCLSL